MVCFFQKKIAVNIFIKNKSCVFLFQNKSNANTYFLSNVVKQSNFLADELLFFLSKGRFFFKTTNIYNEIAYFLQKKAIMIYFFTKKTLQVRVFGLFFI